MKTIYTLFITLLMLPATLNVSAAGQSDREGSDRVRSERRAPSRNIQSNKNEKRSKTYTGNRKYDPSSPNANQEKRSNSNTQRSRSQSERSSAIENRNQSNRNSAIENRNQSNRNNAIADRDQRDRNSSITDRNQRYRNGAATDRNQKYRNGANTDRYRNQNKYRNNHFDLNRNRFGRHNYDRHNNIRFRNNNERCRICFGLGFLWSHDRLHRQRCHTCYGRGFAIGYGHNMVNFCPFCYANLIIGGNIYARSIEEIARIETNKLSVVLDLTDHQANRIYNINLIYLRNRHGDVEYEMQERDKDILDVLNDRQQEMYLGYLENIDSRDLCDNCYALR